jgi:uncharacterized protein YcfJ
MCVTSATRVNTREKVVKTKVLSAMIGAAFANQGLAMDFIDVAPVVSVTPLYGPVADARECFAGPAPQPVMAGGVPVAAGMPPQATAGAPQQPPQERSVLAPIAGGVAGALLGSQVGQGRGRDVATAVGGVAGTVVGDRMANPNSGGSVTGAIVGGGAGALLGNQVGQGSGRTAATAAGAIGGAMVGDRLMSNPQAEQGAKAPGQYPMQRAQAPLDRCRTVDGSTREILRGYSVVYRYSGRDITTTVPYHPGNAIRIAIGALDSDPSQAAYPAGGGYPGGANQTGAQPPGMNPQVPIGGGNIPR